MECVCAINPFGSPLASYYSCLDDEIMHLCTNAFQAHFTKFCM